MKFGINQSISQTITQLSCIQLETPSSRLWNFWWIKTYTTFNLNELNNPNIKNIKTLIHYAKFWETASQKQIFKLITTAIYNKVSSWSVL